MLHGAPMVWDNTRRDGEMRGEREEMGGERERLTSLNYAGNTRGKGSKFREKKLSLRPKG